MIMKAENIDINSKKKMKRDYIVNKKFLEIRKEYRDCINRKWRQDWDMNKSLMIPHVVLCLAYQRERMAYQNSSSKPYIVVQWCI